MSYGLALDIDETLSNTSIYWFKTLSELFGNPESLTTNEIIEKYRYTQNVPYWQIPEALEWMESARNSNEIQERILLIENAHNVVQKINLVLPIKAYITARPSSVADGTKRWLTKHNFPEAKLITRPDVIPSQDGNIWKSKVLEDLYPEIVGIVDDNPGLADRLGADYRGVVFLYDNITHTRTDIDVIPCKTWDDVYSSVLNYELRRSV